MSLTNRVSPQHVIGERTGLASRALALVLAAVLAVCSAAPAAYADVRGTDILAGRSVAERGLPAVSCPNVTAEYAYVVDGSGRVFFEREADAQCHIASITKVMTAIVALDSGAPLDTIVTVGSNAASVGESSAGLQAGDKLTLQDALTGLMVSSGNDAAIAIADTLGPSFATSEGQDAQEAFVAVMNAKAAELGMADTLFANSHGLDVGDFDQPMYSTAHDVALMCAYAMENETFRTIVAQDKATITVARANGQQASIELESTDILLGTYEGACGIKTGFTDLAGECFAGACERGGLMLYAIVLDSPSENARFEDAKALFSWVYDNRMTYALAHSGQTVSYNGSQVPLIAEVPQSCWLDKTVNATMADPTATVEVFAFDGNVSQELTYEALDGAVSAGQVVGTISFYQGNRLLAEQDLIATENSPAPDFLEGLGFWWNRFIAGFSGETLVAKPVVVNETPLIYQKTPDAPSIGEIRSLAAGESAPEGAADDSDTEGAESAPKEG